MERDSHDGPDISRPLSISQPRPVIYSLAKKFVALGRLSKVRATLRYVTLSRILAMTKHHAAWTHFSPQLVLISLTGLQKDPLLHSGERVKKKLIEWISFLHSDTSSSIETSPS